MQQSRAEVEKKHIERERTIFFMTILSYIEFGYFNIYYRLISVQVF